MTFTLPKQLRNIARSNQKLFYKIIFKASWNALKKLARYPRFVGGLIGALAVLQTWSRTLIYHPHIHYLLPAGGLSFEHTKWLPARNKFFMPSKELANIFRAKVRDALKKTELFDDIPKSVWYIQWGVDCKNAGDARAILKYVAPYIFRVAISNKRILKLKNDQVTFAYEDSKTKKIKTMKLHVFEFIRRFLQHVLPKGFKKVRHYGILSSYYKEKLCALQYSFASMQDDTKQELSPKTKIPLCPICGKEMILIRTLQPEHTLIVEQYVPP